MKLPNPRRVAMRCNAAWLTLGLILTACAPAPTPPPVDTMATAVAQAASLLLTQTAAAASPTPPPPTETLTPAPTETPTPAPTAAGDPTIAITLTYAACWFGPGPSYALESNISQGKRVKLLGMGSVSGWFVIRNPYFRQPCWIRASDLQLDPGLDVSTLPVMTP